MAFRGAAQTARNHSTSKRPNLRRLYLQFNRRWFNGKLPRDIKVGWGSRPKHIVASTWGDYRILLSPRIAHWGHYLRFTLLHEMAHVKTWQEDKEHGPGWQREMKRLARIGAFDKYW